MGYETHEAQQALTMAWILGAEMYVGRESGVDYRDEEGDRGL